LVLRFLRLTLAALDLASLSGNAARFVSDDSDLQRNLTRPVREVSQSVSPLIILLHSILTTIARFKLDAVSFATFACLQISQVGQ
jgi:hypothetical protein